MDASIPLTWLHLSDFHFKNDQDWKKDPPLRALIRDILEKLPGLEISPDLVFISGDIAYSGKREEYDRALPFFEHLFQVLKLDPGKHAFPVPGNHDVDRNSIAFLDLGLRDTLTEERIHEALKDQATWRRFSHRQHHFLKFTEKFLGKERAWRLTKPWEARLFRKGKRDIGILCLNSAWVSQDDHDEGNLLISEVQLRESLDAVKKAEHCIALCHHPLESLKPFDRTVVQEMLQGKPQVYFFLRGHLHQAEPLANIGRVGQFGAGACYREAKNPFLVWVCRYDFETRSLTAHGWNYSQRAGGFWSLSHSQEYRPWKRFVDAQGRATLTLRASGKADVLKKTLPLGIQTFSDLRRGNHLYVDKTHLIAKLLTPSKGVYFLARPRRFGKSLLLSTLESAFSGERRLFEGLALAKSGFDFAKRPIVHLDFGGIENRNLAGFEKSLAKELHFIAKKNRCVLEPGPPAEMFKQLIRELAAFGKVVVLVDEYDKAILDNLSRPEVAVSIRDSLRRFYTIIKSEDRNIRFVMLTGVSKFSKVSVFSGLNHLQDLTMDWEYSQLLGWTQQEVERDLKPFLEEFAASQHKTISEVTKLLREWYNGYRFTGADIQVFNPWSVMKTFDLKELKFHWFETGTPTFLFDVIERHPNFDISRIGLFEVGEEAFSTFEVENLDPVPLLFQAGYLTIRDFSGTPENRRYRLGYPNFEVKSAFNQFLLTKLSTLSRSQVSEFLKEIERALLNYEMDRFFEVFKSFLAQIPYDLTKPEEKYFHTIFHVIFKVLELNGRSEEKTNTGRIDSVVETPERIFIYEFKYGGSVDRAIAQIHDKRYYEKYLLSRKEILLVGVVFEERTIREYKVEELRK